MLRTKLHRPPLSAEHVFRFRLIDELNKNINKPFSLVCAPAGYGKSMLVSSWIEESDIPTAWLSLSGEDNDFRTFISYFIAAIQKVFPGRFEKTESLVNAPELPSHKLINHTLINELDQVQENFIIVLDDYHLIRNESIHQFIDELLHYPPEHLHICMLTRRDPPLRIKNLRVHNRMNEVRIDELIFTEVEIIGLFKKLHGITLEQSTAATLHKRTEGWITALQLISLASKNKLSIEDELVSFTGDLHTLSDFLIEEILSNQTKEMKDLMLSTALLDRFCLNLMEACYIPSEEDHSGKTYTGELFDQLINSNLFLIPLDNERKWFRYHHLFQKILISHLGSKIKPDKIKETHHLSAKWFEEEGLIDEAIEQMIKAEEHEAAAKIVITQAHPEFLKNVGRVETWLNKLPVDLQENSPALQLIKAWHAFGQFHLEKIPPILDKVNALLENSTPEPETLSEISFFEGNFQYWMGDTEGSIQTLTLALNQCDYLPEHVRCNIELVRYMALQKKGEYDTAVTDIQNRIKRPDNYTSTDMAYYYGSLTFVHLLEGRLGNALDVAIKMQMYTEKTGSNFLINWSHYLQALTNLQLFQTDIAFKLFENISQKHYIIDTVAVFDSKSSLALIQQLNGNGAEANRLISAAINYAKDIGDPQNILLVQSAEARIAILQEDLQTAFIWAEAFTEPPAYAGMFFWQEIPWITKAKALIAKGTPGSLKEAEEILNSLFVIATSSNLNCQLVEINLLLALTLKKLNIEETSIEKLKTSVIQAEKYGFVRPFIEAGRSAIALLNDLKENKIALDFIQKIEGLVSKASCPKSTTNQMLTKNSEKIMLTEREQETLQLLAEGLRNKEIANKLFVSEGTIKKHVYNMGQKFDTGSRVELLNKARALGFIEN